MSGWIWLVLAIALCATLFYQRASINVFTLALGIFLVLFTRFTQSIHSVFFFGFIWSVFFLIFVPFRFARLRHFLLTKPLLIFYRKVMPTVSRTEREALAAGTVSFEGELFSGSPRWHKLLEVAQPTLSAEEKAFIAGPLETLCGMIDDWDITHRRADIPPAIWQYLKEQGFFSLIIKKEYGGKEFSAFAHAEILAKIYSKSGTVATTVGVPNSLGPAELLMHYGTVEQKNYYLPRLARGEEIPCFALTGPDAGSDAAAMTDTGVVCWGMQDGKEVLGIRLTFNKRYITLAPVATVIGLAFRLFDPEQLLGNQKELGITCALLPRQTPGLHIGRRHFPLNTVFQNGPLHGKDVFIPMDWVIGGIAMVGQGWRMLMECLAAGRAISLPASALGSAKMLTHASGAYARIRRQFNVSIGQFEGIADVLARIAGHTYIMDAVRRFTVAFIDQGAKPAIASAIAKYHVTELGRKVVNDAMDLHGGKAICLGPKNYIGRSYQAMPIAITVEGANILTRNLIIFGQGAIRAHPYIFAELEAASMQDEQASLQAFDRAICGHIGFTVSNIFRSFLLAITGGAIACAPKKAAKSVKYFYRQATRFSAAFALIADMSLLVLGGSLKRREALSARLGDVLSYLYMLSALLKRYQDNNSPIDELPLLHWAAQTCLYDTQQAIDTFLKNFPSRLVAGLLRFLVFPLGKPIAAPSDKLSQTVAALFMQASASRNRLIEGIYMTPVAGNTIAILEDALQKVIAAEPAEKALKTAMRDFGIKEVSLEENARVAFAQHYITQEQLDAILAANRARQEVIAVDDFSSDELVHGKM